MKDRGAETRDRERGRGRERERAERGERERKERGERDSRGGRAGLVLEGLPRAQRVALPERAQVLRARQI